jgi:hypothetical protein
MHILLWQLHGLQQANTSCGQLGEARRLLYHLLQGTSMQGQGQHYATVCKQAVLLQVYNAGASAHS